MYFNISSICPTLFSLFLKIQVLNSVGILDRSDTIWVLSDCPHIACSFNLYFFCFYIHQLKDQSVYNSMVYFALIMGKKPKRICINSRHQLVTLPLVCVCLYDVAYHCRCLQALGVEGITKVVESLELLQIFCCNN